MNEIWRVKIADIGQTITGKTPSSNAPEDFGYEYMFVTPSDPFDKKMMNSTERYLSKEGVDKLSNKVLPPKSIMVTCIGSAMGKVSMNASSCITNQQINSIVPNNLYDPDYIYYAIKNNFKVLRNAATGSTALPLLNKTDFDILELPIHKDKNYQQKISSVLTAIDTKIELNNRINKKLEQMAKTLYDYWFVQFDFPFDFAQGKPNEQGKPYKSSGGKMVYNAELKREIPEGWDVKKLSEIESNIVTGKTPSTTVIENFGGNIPFITIDDIRGQLFILSSERTLSKKGADTQPTKYLKKGDICVSCIGTIGVIGIVNKISQTNQQINTISIQNSDNRYFLLNALKNYFDFNVAAKKGAVLSNMNKAEFSDIPILDSDSSAKEKFNKIVEVVYNKVENNQRQNQQLSSLRDWLLPMLMNGQVTVKEAEGKLDMAAEPNVEYAKK
jgi:type I restriction enzyme, S subunit